MGVIISNCFARMSRYLSGEELMHQCKRSNELPGRGGFKDHEPDGSWLQRMKLENFHAERNEVLSEERVEKLGALSVGDWDPDKKKIVVTRNRGKFWKNMGHCVDGEKLLHPEEALFLVDQGSMEVMYKGQPMSLQELYHKLLPSARSCDDYVLCGHLMRLGFIVRRADTFEEKSSRSNKDKKRVRDDDDDDDDDDDGGVQNSAAKKFKSSADVSGHSSKSQKQEIAKSQTKHDLHAQTSRNNNLNCTDIFALNSDKVCVDPRSLSLALPDLELSEPLEFDVSDERRKMLIIGKDLFENHERRKNFTGVENWTQLKKLSRKERLLLTPARVLWEDDDDDLRPLHDPDVVCTASETLKRLRQRNKKFTIEDVSNIVRDFPSQDLNTVMFNVFPPDSKFKKSKPGRPLACTLSVNAQSPPPLGVEALKLIGEAQRRGGSSLMFGAVESGEVSFFSYNLVDLPTLV